MKTLKKRGSLFFSGGGGGGFYIENGHKHNNMRYAVKPLVLYSLVFYPQSRKYIKYVSRNVNTIRMIIWAQKFAKIK